MQSILNTTRNSWSLDRGKIRRTRSIAKFRSETEVDTFRAFIYGKKNRQTPSPGPRATTCRAIKVDWRNVVVGARWTRKVDFTAQHNTWNNNFPPWRGRTAAIQHARVYNNFPLLQSLSLKRWQWIHRTTSGILIPQVGTSLHHRRARCPSYTLSTRIARTSENTSLKRPPRPLDLSYNSCYLSLR